MSTPNAERGKKSISKRGAVYARRAAFPARKGTRLYVAGSSRAAGRATRAKLQEAVDREQLTIRLLGLVRRVALELREHLPLHVELDDLAGAGVLGLLDAVRKFDARKHVKIETYARHRIRGAILDSLRVMDTASRDMRRKNKNVEKAYMALQSRLGRAVSDEEMAQTLGVSLNTFHHMVHELHAYGVDWMRPHQIPEVPLIDPEKLPSENEPNQYDLCYARERRDILALALARINERERTVISLYYHQEMTMKQIGERMGIDESRVSQLHSAAIDHLRNKVQALLRPAVPVAVGCFGMATAV